MLPKPSSCILGTGRYLPPQVVTNFDLMKVMETSDEFIVQRTGVRRRRYAPPEHGRLGPGGPGLPRRRGRCGPDHGPDRHAGHEHDHARSCRSRLRFLPAGQAGPGAAFPCSTSSSNVPG